MVIERVFSVPGPRKADNPRDFVAQTCEVATALGCGGPRKRQRYQEFCCLETALPTRYEKSCLCWHPPLSFGALRDWVRGIDVHDLMMIDLQFPETSGSSFLVTGGVQIMVNDSKEPYTRMGTAPWSSRSYAQPVEHWRPRPAPRRDRRLCHPSLWPFSG